MTIGAGLTRIGVCAEADNVASASAAGAVIVTGKITRMTHDALAIRRSGAGSRTFQSAIGGQIMTGGAAIHGMSLAQASEWRNQGAVASDAVGGHRRYGGIDRNRHGMTIGMTTKIVAMTVGAGGGGAVTKCWAGRIKSDTGDVQKIAGIGPQERWIAVTGLTGIAMNGQRVVGQMLVTVGAGRGVDQKIMGRQNRLEPLCRAMAVSAFQGGIMPVIQRILGPVTCLRMANLADTLAGCLLIGKATLAIQGIGIKEGDLSVSRRRGRDDLPDQLTIDETKRSPCFDRIHRAFYGYDTIVGANDLVGGIFHPVSTNHQDQAPVKIRVDVFFAPATPVIPTTQDVSWNVIIAKVCGVGDSSDSDGADGAFH